MELKQHPLSAAYPAMPEADFIALVQDISAHGQRDVATLFEGAVIDGWHRYRACLQAGIECRFEQYSGDDPAALVRSKNKFRRHLDKSQYAAVEVAISAWKPAHREKKGEPGSPLSASNEQMAAAAGVSVKTIKQAKKAHEAGLGDAVRDGVVSAKKAAVIADLPEPQRKAAIEHPETFQQTPKKKKPELTVIEGGKDAAELAALRDERDELAQSLAEMADDLEGYMSAATPEQHEVAAQFKALKAELQTAYSQRDDYMRKCTEMAKQIKSLQRSLGRYEKASA